MIDEAFGHWFAGFFAGEGSFTIKRNRPAHSHVCRADIAQRRDNRAILDEIQSRVGGLVHLTYNDRGTGRGDKPQARWSITTKTDALRLVAIFDRFPLRTRKAEDFAIWRETVLLWQSVPGRWEQVRDGQYDWSPFAELAARLRAGRRYALSEAA